MASPKSKSVVLVTDDGWTELELCVYDDEDIDALCVEFEKGCDSMGGVVVVAQTSSGAGDAFSPFPQKESEIDRDEPVDPPITTAPRGFQRETVPLCRTLRSELVAIPKFRRAFCWAKFNLNGEVYNNMVN